MAQPLRAKWCRCGKGRSPLRWADHAATTSTAVTPPRRAAAAKPGFGGGGGRRRPPPPPLFLPLIALILAAGAPQASAGPGAPGYTAAVDADLDEGFFDRLQTADQGSAEQIIDPRCTPGTAIECARKCAGRQLEPICASDGQTYEGGCEAECACAEVISFGPCADQAFAYFSRRPRGPLLFFRPPQHEVAPDGEQPAGAAAVVPDANMSPAHLGSNPLEPMMAPTSPAAVSELPPEPDGHLLNHPAPPAPSPHADVSPAAPLAPTGPAREPAGRITTTAAGTAVVLSGVATGGLDAVQPEPPAPPSPLRPLFGPEAKDPRQPAAAPSGHHEV